MNCSCKLKGIQRETTAGFYSNLSKALLSKSVDITVWYASFLKCYNQKINKGIGLNINISIRSDRKSAYRKVVTSYQEICPA